MAAARNLFNQGTGMTKNFKITVITVTFNSAATLEETIKSVLSQEYDGEVEYMIIDGGSTDGTVEIIRKYQDKLSYWVSEADYGLYHAMNKGLERATGEIIGIINSDDWYYPGALSKVASAMKDKDLKTHIFWGDIVYGDEVIKGWRPLNLRHGAFGVHPAMFCPRAVYESIGKYRLWYKILSDYDFMYRAIHVHGIKAVYLPEKIAYFRLGGLASRHIFRAYTEEMLAKVENGETVVWALGEYLLKLLRYYLLRLFRHSPRTRQ